VRVLLRALCLLPSEPVEESTWSPAKAEAMKYLDRMHERLVAEAA
jgi:hypothetical protein